MLFCQLQNKPKARIHRINSKNATANESTEKSAN
jgi:hypothetical protein